MTSAVLEVLQRAPLGIVVVSSDLSIRFSNPRFRSMLGGRADDPLPDSLGDLVARPQDLFELPEAQLALQGEQPIWVTVSAEPFSMDGEDVQILWVVPSEKQVHEELRRVQRDLMQAERMAALGSLVAGVAHEINTPLGNTLTAASHLNDKGGDLKRLFDENRLKRNDLAAFIDLHIETTQLMVTNCERAAELVQSFKQVAVDQTSGERRPFELKGYIEEILLSLRPRLRKTKHEITVECPENIEIDSYPGAFSQVLTNLVLNALLHAYEPDEAGRITILVKRPRPDIIELAFSDHGRGIAPDHIGKVFDPFYTTKRGAGGSGLGLHIVYNIVTSTLKGQIAVASELGRGAHFTIRFPTKTPADPAKETA